MVLTGNHNNQYVNETCHNVLKIMFLGDSKTVENSMTYFFEDNYPSRYISDYASFELMGMTLSEFEKSIKDRTVRTIDLIETQDNFGIQYSVKVNVIKRDNEPSAYLLTSERHKILYFESIENLHSSLQKIGYTLPKTGLKLLSDYSEF